MTGWWMVTGALAAPEAAVDVGASGPAEGAVDLVVAQGDVRCVMASGRAEGERVWLDPLDAALATWLERDGTLSAAAPGTVPRCDGLPAVETVTVPAGGWAIGLRRPGQVALADGVEIVPMGDDGLWWHLLPWEGNSAVPVVLTHSDAPPTRLLARRDDSLVPPAGLVVPVPKGGVTVVALDGPTSYVRVATGPAKAIGLGAQLLVLGTGSGDGVLREVGAPPRSLRVELDRPLPQNPDAVVVPLGKTRKLAPDVTVAAAWSGDPGVVGVDVVGRKLVLTGVGLGPAQLALLDEQGRIHVVSVAVGR